MRRSRCRCNTIRSNREFGGNYDGEGFINQIVSEISSYKAIWVNAGNYGSMVWNGSFKESRSDYIYHDNGSSLNFEVKFDATPVTITAAWNDFKLRTASDEKDLDLEIWKSSTKQMFRNKRQSSRVDDGLARSLHAREQDRLILDAGSYSIKMKDISNNFDRSDKFRAF